MKNFVWILMLALAANVCAQTADNFTVKAKVGIFNAPAKAYLIYQANEKNVIDSAVIQNGVFNFHGNITGPSNALIVMNPTGVNISQLNRNADALNFFIEKADIVVNSPDSVSKALITGSKLNDDNQKLKDLLKPVEDRAKALAAEAAKAPDAQKINPDFQNGIQQKYKVIQYEENFVMKKFIAANPQSYISLAALGSLAGQDTDPADIEKMFNGLSAEVQGTEAGKRLRKELDAVKLTAVGAIAPDFTQADTSGKPVALSSLRGKYVLVDFWASWCVPCRLQNPNLVKAYQQFKGKNFTILGVSLDKPDGKAVWLKAIKDDGLTWYQVSDLKYWNNETARLYNISSIPQNFLLDPTGKIIAKNLANGELAAKLAEIFKMGNVVKNSW